MLIELNKKRYEYVLECFDKLKPEYCDEIKNSLVIDNNMVLLGFSKEPIYTIKLDLPIDVIEEILNYINNLRKKSFNNNSFDDNLYTEFDRYIDFYNLINSLK